jgi:RNA binding exosome subunit
MASVPFHYVDLRTFCYATEDEKRVEAALRTFIPERDGEPTVEIERAETEGANGDRILVLSARLERADEMRYALSQVAEADEIDRVLAELDQRVDDNCSLFLRLSKQDAFQGRAALGDGLSFRAKVEAYPAERATAVENAREAFEELLADAA